MSLHESGEQAVRRGATPLHLQCVFSCDDAQPRDPEPSDTDAQRPYSCATDVVKAHLQRRSESARGLAACCTVEPQCRTTWQPQMQSLCMMLSPEDSSANQSLHEACKPALRPTEPRYSDADLGLGGLGRCSEASPCGERLFQTESFVERGVSIDGVAAESAADAKCRVQRCRHPRAATDAGRPKPRARWEPR